MPNLLQWHQRPDLLGRYAVTTERYGVAWKRTAYYLLQLPKQGLEEILIGIKSDIFETPIMRLIGKVLPTFLARSPPTTDLYFLVLVTSPVMKSLVFYSQQGWGKPKVRLDISSYEHKVSMLQAIFTYECPAFVNDHPYTICINYYAFW